VAPTKTQLGEKGLSVLGEWYLKKCAGVRRKGMAVRQRVLKADFLLDVTEIGFLVGEIAKKMELSHPHDHVGLFLHFFPKE